MAKLSYEIQNFLLKQRNCPEEIKLSCKSPGPTGLTIGITEGRSEGRGQLKRYSASNKNDLGLDHLVVVFYATIDPDNKNNSKTYFGMSL